jgi:hypothetical protein
MVDGPGVSDPAGALFFAWLIGGAGAGFFVHPKTSTEKETETAKMKIRLIRIGFALLRFAFNILYFPPIWESKNRIELFNFIWHPKLVHIT